MTLQVPPLDHLDDDPDLLGKICGQFCYLLREGQRNMAANEWKEAFASYDSIRRLLDNLQLFALQKQITCSLKSMSAEETLKLSQMIVKDYPTASAGYLESARILENQARYGEAFLIYYTAKQHIRPDDLYFKEIESRKSLPLSKIDQINTKSIKRLSPDVFDSILADLSLPDRIHCAQTCKGWRHKFIAGLNCGVTMIFVYSRTLNSYQRNLKTSRCVA